MADIMFAGAGGQGVLTAGKILTEIAAETQNVCWTSEYSAEMRGGYALARVVISKEEIGTPYPDFLDILCCMDENSYKNYGMQVRPGGTIVINTSLYGQDAAPHQEGVQIIGVSCMDIASTLNNARGANLVMLGAMVHATGVLDENHFGQTLLKYFEKKGKNGQSNLACFEAGCAKAEPL